MRFYGGGQINNNVNTFEKFYKIFTLFSYTCVCPSENKAFAVSIGNFKCVLVVGINLIQRVLHVLVC